MRLWIILFKDNILFSTTSGTSFMVGFNQVYYLFSPTIADWERENTVFRELIQAFITPMITTLSIMTIVDESSEFQILVFGLSVIVLNIGMYVGMPVIVLIKTKNYVKIRTLKNKY
jgi:hypothetical protein